jgi:hypothetical protein
MVLIISANKIKSFVSEKIGLNSTLKVITNIEHFFPDTLMRIGLLKKFVAISVHTSLMVQSNFMIIINN